MNDIKLVCIDVDGTLVNDEKIIPQANIDAIAKALKKGVKFEIMSGRIAPSTKEYMDKIGAEGPVSSLGGCLLQDTDGTVLEEFTIPREASIHTIKTARKLGCYLFFYHHDHWYAEPYLSERWKDSELKATGVEGIIYEDLIELLDHFLPNKFLALHENIEIVSKFKKELDPQVEGVVETFFSWPEFLEVVPKEANKGKGVAALCKYYGIKKENVMSCGDYYNDLTMFAESGVSVAMANAEPLVKERATYVTKADNNNGGVAEAIEKFVL